MINRDRILEWLYMVRNPEPVNDHDRLPLPFNGEGGHQNLNSSRGLKRPRLNQMPSPTSSTSQSGSGSDYHDSHHHHHHYHRYYHQYHQRGGHIGTPQKKRLRRITDSFADDNAGDDDDGLDYDNNNIDNGQDDDEGDDDAAGIEGGEQTPRGPAHRPRPRLRSRSRSRSRSRRSRMSRMRPESVSASASAWARAAKATGSGLGPGPGPGISNLSSRLSGGSSSKNSTNSKKSQSPAKRMRSLNFCVLQMNPAHPRFPLSLRSLLMSLDALGTRVGVVPNNLRDDLMTRRLTDARLWNIDEHAFASPLTAAYDDMFAPISSLDVVLDVYSSAQECFNMDHAESSWNMLAHWPIFKLALTGTKTMVGAMPCTTARLTGDTKGSKMVDFCMYLDPSTVKDKDGCSDATDDAAAAAQRLYALSRCSLGFTVNHTDYNPLCLRPIVVSAECKKPGENLAEAHLQVAVWQDAQLSLLRSQSVTATTDIIPFLPSIVIQGHDWQFTATSQDSHGTVCTCVLFSSTLVPPG